jgi:alkylhydroperoxidase family enzyme
MPRIPYRQLPEEGVDQALADVVAQIKARRGGALLNLDLTLLHSPAFARAWNGFLNTVRRELSVSPKLRELAICCVAVLNGADYEFKHHAPEFVKAGGTQTQVEALKDPDAALADTALFNSSERLVIRLALEMTRDVKVTDETFGDLQAVFSHQHIVELVGTVATYNMVSRFLVALQIGMEPKSPSV